MNTFIYNIFINVDGIPQQLINTLTENINFIKVHVLTVSEKSSLHYKNSMMYHVIPEVARRLLYCPLDRAMWITRNLVINLKAHFLYSPHTLEDTVWTGHKVETSSQMHGTRWDLATWNIRLSAEIVIDTLRIKILLVSTEH